ncbi:DDB1- and CUL4-associated factor 1-like isoform X2 [Nelusetta ayraudi]
MSSPEEQQAPLLPSPFPTSSSNQAVAAKADLAALLDQWEEARASGATERLVQVITRICELMEQETAEYYKTDPDPFDDRHPGHADPECMLGQLLKMLFTNDFTNALLDSYVMSSREAELNSAACRLLLSMAPGLDTALVFQEKDGLVEKLFDWAQTGASPLAAYATALLARALSVQEVAAKHLLDAIQLGRTLIHRLYHLQRDQNQDPNHNQDQDQKPPQKPSGDSAHSLPQSSPSPSLSGHCLAPLSPVMEQSFILQYLTPLAAYKELLGLFMRMDTRLPLITYILQPHTQPHWLTFHALLCLASLLLHKKFAAEFISQGAVQQLLQIPRPSVAATGVCLCLHQLSSNHDTMERVCTLPEAVLREVVSYVLWCLEGTQQSVLLQATMFLSVSFSFRPLLQLFDRQDGLRRLVNLISTLDSNQSLLSDDQVFSNRQRTKHTCLALRRYFEAHLAVKTERVKQSLHPSEGGAVVPQKLFYKALSPSREQQVEMMEFLLEAPLLLRHWEPVHTFCSLSCVPLLLRLLSAACDWTGYHGSSEVVRNVLEVLTVLTLVPSVRPLLADTVEVLDETDSTVCTVGMSIILGVAEGGVFPGDGDIQKAALQVITNCVCAPEPLAAPPLRRPRPSAGSAPREATPTRKPRPQHQELSHMWQLVQNNNGIKVLLSLLSVQTPVTEADLIRALACRALLGLSRSATIRQIISKLPLFTSGHMQQLMKEPVLQDKRTEHVRFCGYAAQLTAVVLGKSRLLTPGADVSLAGLQRAEVVARSWVTFSQQELLLLIRDHLLAKGLAATAATLVKEAGLVTPPLPAGTTPSLSTPTTPTSSCFPSTSCSAPPGPRRPGSQPIGRILFSPRDRPAVATPTGPGRRHRALRQKSDHGPFAQSPAMRKVAEPGLAPASPTLDDIIRGYLREQHARCPNPVSTCPPFSLYRHHRCPEPRPHHHRHAPANFTARLGSRPLGRPPGPAHRLDTHLVFGRFRPMTVFHREEGDASSSSSSFTCSAFSASQRHLLLGTSSGHLQLHNITTRGLVAEYPCHTGSITHLEPSRDGKLLLTSAASWTFPMSALWSTDGVVTNQKFFADEHHVEFSKASQDQVVGTKEQVAHVYDVQTGRRTLTLFQESLAGRYRRNRATFSPSDQLLLNDGVLWDVRSSRAVHRFDQFNGSVSGQFHPNGLEVVANTEVWDLRTFHLLHHVPALDQCHLVFNSSATVMYAAVLQDQDQDQDEVLERQTKSPLRSSFRTFDATDYKPITTVDVKRDISHLCTDGRDCYLAVIQSQDAASQDTVCRLYQVGRHQLAEESDHDQDEDDEDEESSDSEDDEDDLDSLIAAVEQIEQEDDELEEEQEEPDQEVEDLLDQDSEESEAFPTDNWDSMDEEIWNSQERRWFS